MVGHEVADCDPDFSRVWASAASRWRLPRWWPPTRPRPVAGAITRTLKNADRKEPGQRFDPDIRQGAPRPVRWCRRSERPCEGSYSACRMCHEVATHSETVIDEVGQS